MGEVTSLQHPALLESQGCVRAWKRSPSPDGERPVLRLVVGQAPSLVSNRARTARLTRPMRPWLRSEQSAG